ncbi:MAG: glucan biosynthesis protein G [Burkholderiales bacterium]|nr:glucan biosynthesis protein G [Burkholderiales bacterium]
MKILRILCHLPWLAVVMLTCVLPSGSALAFGFNDVAALARKLADSPYKKPESKTPQELRNLTYDQYREIRFKPERARWRTARLQFELTFHHQGQQFSEAVRIDEISSDGVSAIRFNPDDFDYGSNRIDLEKMRGIGFAGFRVHYPVNAANRKDEITSFLGASYFRALGKGQHYGLSARGLAVDTALMSGEEFPRFVEFWIERPSPAAKELVVYALLDSRSMTGAYRFVLRPGNDTITDVRARLYLRNHVSKLGLAPLTSMYFFGENQRSGTEDYRPEVHDSDGLLMQSGTGEWIWRPLQNPRRLLVTSFALINPQGFGLMQRDRAFSSYEALDHRYELRPSAWIEPRGQWGEGRIELVQIPTPDETNDNIVAFWVPAEPPQPKQPYDFEYRLTWQKEGETRPPMSWVTQTRRGQNQGRNNKPDDSILFAIDFISPALAKLPEDVRPDGIATIDANGVILENRIRRNEVTNGWRMTLRVRHVDVKKPVEIRAFLRHENNTLSETWSYILPPG